MIIPSLSFLLGLVVLVWSADLFVDGAASVSKHYGMSSLLIGMVVVGFGTSAPEMIVSGIASFQGNSGIALGNIYGSNITNIALILGATAMFRPISVHSQVLRKELPILILVSIFSILLVLDLELSRFDAILSFLIFTALIIWTISQSFKRGNDSLAADIDKELGQKKIDFKKSYLSLIVGLVLLIFSSRLLVWGAVEIATILGVSSIVIGLTVVAIGTSLPELASSIMAARKGESDIAIGNIIGSNFFNTLAVAGVAGSIHPLSLTREMLVRDLPIMLSLTILLFIFGYGFKKQGRINRYEGAFLLLSYFLYTFYLVKTEVRL